MRQIFLFLIITILGCEAKAQNDLNFEAVVALVKKFEKPILIENETSKILVSNSQSQIITSTANGSKGYSYGWLNPQAIEKNIETKSTFFYGGEDRFWLNPLGSKFSLFYDQKEIKPENWKIPKLFESAVFELKSKSKNSVIFEKQATIYNNIGTAFSIDIEREIELFSEGKIKDLLRIKNLDNIKTVGFCSSTKITNIGIDWKQEKGLIAPWTIGMFKGTNTSIGIFPFKDKGKPLNLRKYFLEGKENRWVNKDRVILFKTDGSLRSKIGLPVENSRFYIGNYDYKNKRLTIIRYSLDEEGRYLSSTETEKALQFNGDVVNSYNNDSSDGKPTFFELETTAPAKALKTNESIKHKHFTFHFEGDFKSLNSISKQILGADLQGVENTF